MFLIMLLLLLEVAPSNNALAPKNQPIEEYLKQVVSLDQSQRQKMPKVLCDDRGHRWTLIQHEEYPSQVWNELELVNLASLLKNSKKSWFQEEIIELLSLVVENMPSQSSQAKTKIIYHHIQTIKEPSSDKVLAIRFDQKKYNDTGPDNFEKYQEPYISIVEILIRTTLPPSLHKSLTSILEEHPSCGNRAEPNLEYLFSFKEVEVLMRTTTELFIVKNNRIPQSFFKVMLEQLSKPNSYNKENLQELLKWKKLPNDPLPISLLSEVPVKTNSQSNSLPGKWKNQLCKEAKNESINLKALEHAEAVKIKRLASQQTPSSSQHRKVLKEGNTLWKYCVGATFEDAQRIQAIQRKLTPKGCCLETTWYSLRGEFLLQKMPCLSCDLDYYIQIHLDDDNDVDLQLGLEYELSSQKGHKLLWLGVILPKILTLSVIQFQNGILHGDSKLNNLLWNKEKQQLVLTDWDSTLRRLNVNNPARSLLYESLFLPIQTILRVLHPDLLKSLMSFLFHKDENILTGSYSQSFTTLILENDPIIDVIYYQLYKIAPNIAQIYQQIIYFIKQDQVFDVLNSQYDVTKIVQDCWPNLQSTVSNFA